jgi:hypothetical protein
MLCVQDTGLLYPIPIKLLNKAEAYSSDNLPVRVVAWFALSLCAACMASTALLLFWTYMCAASRNPCNSVALQMEVSTNLTLETCRRSCADTWPVTRSCL